MAQNVQGRKRRFGRTARLLLMAVGAATVLYWLLRGLVWLAVVTY